MADELERFVQICETEIRKGGDYHTRIVEMPIFRRLDKEYDNLSDVIASVEKRLFKDDPIGFFIEVTWNNMVEARRTLMQAPKGAAILMDTAEEEATRLVTGLYYYYKEHIDAYLKDHPMKDFTVRIYTYVKERIAEMLSERDKLYLEDELKDMARGLWEKHPEFSTEEIEWLLSMYARGKLERYVNTNGKEALISLIEQSKNVVLLEI